MSAIIQRSLAAGEISPSLQTRVDTSRYQTGLKTLRNHVILRSGGTQNRAGTEFIGQARYAMPQTFNGFLSFPNAFTSSKVRLVPFVFNSDQTYVLEFGAFYMSVIKDGQYVTTNSGITISSITKSSQCVVSQTAHGYSNGDVIGFNTPLLQELVGRTFYVSDVLSDSYKLRYLTGAYVDSTNFTDTIVNNGDTYRLFTLVTPYSIEEIQEFQFVQSADVMTIAHQSHAPMNLSRLADTNWTLVAIVFTPTTTAPTGVTNDGTAGTLAQWVVTTIASESFEESLPSSSTGANTLPTSGSPITVSWSPVTGAQEYNIYKNLNGIYGFIGVASGTSFVDMGTAPDTTATPPIARNPFASDGVINMQTVFRGSTTTVEADAHGFSTGDIVYISNIAGNNSDLNNEYFLVNVQNVNVFDLKDLNGNDLPTSIFSGTTSTNTGQVEKIENYPAVVSYYQQRQLFANTRANPETVYASQTGKFNNFTFSTPTQDDDAVTFNLAGRQVNAVKHLVEISKLLNFTQAGEWTVEGDDAGILRPGFINPKQQSYNGASSLSPVVINGSAIYVQGRGSAVRDIAFDFQIDGYRGNDLTIFSNHLFDGHTLIDVAYQQIPHSILWCIRDDGVLLGMTYIKEQQIIGWHRHDFEGGIAENICVIPEGDEDVLYISVKRTINGVETRYIERMATRFIDNIVDVKILDSYSTYDGSQYNGYHQYPSTGITMTLTGGSTWNVSESLTLTASDFIFAMTDVGNEFRLTSTDGSTVRLKIVGFTDNHNVTVRAEKNVTVQFQNMPISQWVRATRHVSGLWHLEGKEVSVFADGLVAASPYNLSYTTVTVTNGAITLDRPYGLIHVGLPITADFQTLAIDTPQGQTISHQLKMVDRVSFTLENSRGLWAGCSAPVGPDLLDGLNELKIRNTENYEDPIALFTGVEVISIRPEWKSAGSVFIRQVDPVPVSILGVTPIGLYPFKQGAF